MAAKHTVNGTLYEIEISKDRKTVTIWAGGNYNDSPVEHFGATPDETESEIIDQVKDWLDETWGDR